MVERLHRQLKAAIMCHQTKTWTDALPLVLLGIRSTFKPDVQATPAELTYGEPLQLPGEFLEKPSPERPQPKDITNFVDRLRQQMEQLRPVPGSNHNKSTHTFIFQDLASCTDVFLRDDTVRGALQPPYKGPFPVIQRDLDKKTMKIRIRGKETLVSIDRVKPAYTEADNDRQPALKQSTPEPSDESTTNSAPLAEKTYTTRSGRKVTFRLP